MVKNLKKIEWSDEAEKSVERLPTGCCYKNAVGGERWECGKCVQLEMGVKSGEKVQMLLCWEFFLGGGVVRYFEFLIFVVSPGKAKIMGFGGGNDVVCKRERN